MRVVAYGSRMCVLFTHNFHVPTRFSQLYPQHGSVRCIVEVLGTQHRSTLLLSLIYIFACGIAPNNLKYVLIIHAQVPTWSSCIFQLLNMFYSKSNYTMFQTTHYAKISHAPARTYSSATLYNIQIAYTWTCTVASVLHVMINNYWSKSFSVCDVIFNCNFVS